MCKIIRIISIYENVSQRIGGSVTKVIALISIFFTLNTFALFEINESKALLQDEKNTISIFKDSVNSVVHISNIGKVRRRGLFFDYDPMEVVKGEGTGFVWDQEGHIVTNFHVVQGGSKFTVNFHKDKKAYKAKLVGVEPSKDIAVLKLIERPKNLKGLVKGDSKTLQVGQKAVAIGNPFGLDNTITQGIISATGRSIKGISGIKIFDMIQTDSSINPGNSGGPLFNSKGEVIGVNTMIFSNSGSSSGVGFAVPINTVKLIVPQLVKYGQVKRAGLGIKPISREELAYYYGIDLEKGLPIGMVFDGGPAEEAGLKGMTQNRDSIFLGDIILEVDGKPINSFDDIFNVLFEYKIGEKVKVKVLRGKEEKVFQVKLKELKSN